MPRALRFPPFRVQKEKIMLSESAMSNPMILMETSSGDILLELFEDKAPVTVANFLRYMDEDFYSNTIFPRVIKDFMIQGGDPKGDGTGGWARCSLTAKYTDKAAKKRNAITSETI